MANVSIECLKGAVISGKECYFCKPGKSYTFSGLKLVYDTGRTLYVRWPFEVNTQGTRAVISWDQDNTVAIDLAQTIYATMPELTTVLQQCLAGGSGNGAENFTELLDTPNSYVGNALNHVRVNAAGNALEFVSPPDGSETVITAGANVTVGGSGTSGDPYIIAASGGGGGGAPSYYNAGDNFWVWASDSGVTVSEGSQGVYTMTIPLGVVVYSFHRDFTLASEFTVGGDVELTITWTGASFNTSRADAVYPEITFVDSGGVRRQPGDVAVTVDHTSVSGGSTSTTIAGINGLGTPVSLQAQLV